MPSVIRKSLNGPAAPVCVAMRDNVFLRVMGQVLFRKGEARTADKAGKRRQGVGGQGFPRFLNAPPASFPNIIWHQTTNRASLPLMPGMTSSRASTRSRSSGTCEMIPTSRLPSWRSTSV